MDQLARAADFIWRNARLLERALFAHAFLGAPAEPVHRAVLAYRNAGGGFGHALEPDVRAPTSMPLHIEIALRALQQAGVHDHELALGVCDFLASVAREDGAAPIALPEMLDYPRAAHWSAIDPDDDPLNNTAALTGLLWWQGVTHPWLERATAWCWQRLERPVPEAHALRSALLFLRHVPEPSRAAALAGTLATQAYQARWFKAEPEAGGYGLTPLDLVPEPDAPGHAAFAAPVIAAHLDALAAQQQADGGWPITWEPPGPGAHAEWRGMVTYAALRTLRAYGRL